MNPKIVQFPGRMRDYQCKPSLSKFVIGLFGFFVGMGLGIILTLKAVSG